MISNKQFQMAMDAIGAVPIEGEKGSRYNVSVSAYIIGETMFKHSGSYYIVIRGNKPDEKIFNMAMAEFGEVHPGDKNFWWGEVHSIEGLLTLSTMIRGDYSKEKVEKIANNIYKEQLANLELYEPYIEFAIPKEANQKLKELASLVSEFDNLCNPCLNYANKMKEPLELKRCLNLAFGQGALLSFGNDYGIIKFSKAYEKDANMPYYHMFFYNNIAIGKDSGYTVIRTYFDDLKDKIAILTYDPYDDKYHKDEPSNFNRPDYVDLRINSNTGMAWRTYREKDAISVTEQQLDTMIFHYNRGIERLKGIIKNMLEDDYKKE